eukprot:scaffold3747_cov202-Prasinococcus_capsulatus_cf.AAC.1
MRRGTPPVGCVDACAPVLGEPGIITSGDNELRSALPAGRCWAASCRAIASSSMKAFTAYTPTQARPVQRESRSRGGARRANACSPNRSPSSARSD